MSDIAVVTGAAGALGRAVVADLRERDWTVVAFDRPGPALDDIGSLAGVHPVEVDLTDRAAVGRAWQQADAIGSASALIALAGGFVPGSLAELDEQALAALWESNVVSLLWCCQQGATRLAGGGAIVTVGSKTAVTGQAAVAHASSKAAVVRITELLADELRPEGIRVNCVLPSVIDTPANRTWMPESLAERAVAPEAIAKVIAFLVGPDSAPISGARVPVYGDA
ncbi:MAG TPA: SDR family oxidoreductase [Pseudonocardiaceae bacterium]|nr:SDR family oxidoreductase [Pseudonocardiaceae bacterium]